MSSRALSLAAVMLLIGCLAAASAQAENLDAGKTASQIFAGTCSECHKSSRGLLRKVPAGSLPGFLRQHYTTGGQMAAVLSAYLIANGAADRRLPPPDGQPKPGTDAKPDAEPRQATRPDADGSSPQVDRRGRRRLVRPGEAPDAAKPGDDVPAQSASERGPDGRRLRRGRPGSEELPKRTRPRLMPPRRMPPGMSLPRASRPRTSNRRARPPKARTANPRAANRRAMAGLKPPRKRSRSMHQRRRGSLRYCGPIRFLRLRRRRPLLRPRPRRLPMRFPNGPRSRRRHPLRRRSHHL
jgi:hypothetical protein